MLSEKELKRYTKKSGYSYAFGSFPTFELLRNRPDTAERILIHSAISPDIRHKLEALCGTYRIPLTENDRILEKIREKDSCLVAGVFISLDLMQYEDVVCSADALANKRDLLVSFLRMVIDANDILSKDFELQVSTYSKWMTDNGKEIDEAEARMECTQKPLMTSEQIQELIDGHFGEYEKMVWEMSIESGSISADTISKLDSNVISDLMREALAK